MTQQERCGSALVIAAASAASFRVKPRLTNDSGWGDQTHRVHWVAPTLWTQRVYTEPDGGTKMPNRMLVLVWLVCLIGGSLSLAHAQVDTAKDAATKAAAFATAQNMPWGDDIQTVLRQNVNAARKAEWVTTYGNLASVGVDQRTGAVVCAVDFSEVTAHVTAKAPAKLDQAAALTRAQDIVTRAGLTSVANLGTPDVQLQQADPDAWRFAIKYPLLYQGLPYEYGCVTVMLAAEDGKLLALSSAIDVPVPASTAATVDQNAATTSAVGYAAKVAPAMASPQTSAKLMIVAPNSYWNAWGLGAKEDGTVARTAWVVTAKQNGGELIFWIDAADGLLLGGTQSLRRGSPPGPRRGLAPRGHSRPPPPHWLRPARRRRPPRHRRPRPLPPPPPPHRRLKIFPTQGAGAPPPAPSLCRRLPSCLSVFVVDTPNKPRPAPDSLCAEEIQCPKMRVS